MKGIQLTAGYFLESIKKLLNDNFPDKSHNLLENLSYFELESTENVPDYVSNYPAILAVANNIVSRGLPTRMSYELEKSFSKLFPYLEEYPELGGSYYKIKKEFLNDELINQFWEALHIIDPRLNKENIKIDYEESFEKLGSAYEEDFLLKQIPNFLGEYFIQLLESQRYLNELLKLSEAPNNLEQNFKDQRVDFSIEYPYKLDNSNQNGIIIEIDGSQHNQAAQQYLDGQRDQAANECNWQPIRIKTSQWDSIAQKLHSLIQLQNEDYFQTLKRNYTKSFDGEWLDILQLVLSPITIARIQKTIIELLMRGVLNLDSKNCSICIIERDVPCGHLAIKDIETFLENLFSLETKGETLPYISFKIYSTTEFINSKVHQSFQTNINHIDDIKDDTNSYDVVLDVSILQRSRLSPKLNFPIHPKYYFKIRSAHSVRTKRKIISSDLIEYPSFIEPDTSGNFIVKENHKYVPTVLEYFLKNIFRKNDFRIGQLPILSRALSQKNVVGLLPTGGGKSLTYQLAALLQPGITIIIDPIKSLMKDQVDGLKRNLIDNCIFINSSMNWQQRKEAHKKIANGEVLFTFVSPERLQMEEFRNVLESLPKNNLYSSFCVIDEAHCVSEWGHDFRTSYLRLGENATKYCQTKSGNPVTIFGLTATASFDVLSDILREISNRGNILESDAIVRFETTNRPEIQYEVIKVDIENNDDIWEIKKQLGKAKQDKINELLNIIPSKLSYYNAPINQEGIFNDAYKDDPEREKQVGKFEKEKEYKRIQIENFSDDPNIFYNSGCSNAGIIFCPHRSWFFGVTDKYEKGKRNFGVFENIDTYFTIKSGTFLGVDNENDGLDHQIEIDNIQNQDAFINNKLNLMICTKAFGMGIDKPDIRFSIHLNYPQSIESFVQESGRSGRDGKLSIAIILLNDQQFDTNEGAIEIDKDILEFFHSNSFRGKDWEIGIVNYFIDQIQSNLKSDGIFNLTLPFSNKPEDIYKEIKLFLISKYKKNIETRLIHKYFSFEFNDFQKWLNEEYKINISNEDLLELGKIYYRRVEKADTDKAVYRLSTLGIIDEYEVDYRTNTYKIKGSKKTDKQIEKYLKSYLRKYYSEQRVNLELSIIPSIVVDDNNNYLHKSISFLISFIYNEIAKKRKQAINDMKVACQYRLTKSNIEFKDYIYYYFNSKYAREGYEEEYNGNIVSQSLYDIIEKEKIDDITTVWKFIEFVGSVTNNFRHLRGACIRLLQLQPDYLSILLLKSYAVFAIEQDNPILLEDGKNDFIKGCELYFEKIKYDNIKFFSVIDRFIDNVKEHTANQVNPKIKQVVALVKLNAHNQWLEKTITTLES